MKFYVIANSDTYDFDTEAEAIEYSNLLYNDDKVKYLEYGLLNYDSWLGKLSVVILKPYEVGSYFKKLNTGGN